MKAKSHGWRRLHLRRVVTMSVGAGIMLALLSTPVSAAAGDGAITVTGSMDGRPFSRIDANAPHRLGPERPTVLTVNVRNTGNEPVEVRSVRLSASVLGLSFLNYTTRVDLVVAPGGTGTRTFELDLSDLAGQARGLLPGAVDVLGNDRQVLARQDVPLDVEGDLRSVYGIFGLGIGAITALLFLALVARLGAGRLPANRWSRAWRFAIPGVGLGLTMSLTLSVLRFVLPSRTASLLFVVVGALVGLAIGYLSPAPDDGTGREDIYEEDFAETTRAVAADPAAAGLGGLTFSPPKQILPESMPRGLGSTTRPTQ